MQSEESTLPEDTFQASTRSPEIEPTLPEDKLLASSDKPTLLEIIRDGTVEKLGQYLDSNPEAIDVMIDGSSLLHHAVKYRNLEMVRLLIERGSKMIDTPDDKYHRTPLMEACRNIKQRQTWVNKNNHQSGVLWLVSDFDAPISGSEMVKVLIQHGARGFRILDIEGGHPFGRIFGWWNSSIGEWMMANVDQFGISPRQLLDTPDAEENTALHYATMNGNLGMVSAILRWGSKAINAINGDGRTPLGEFLLNGAEDEPWAGIELLRALGADPRLGLNLLDEAEIDERYLDCEILEERILELRFGVYFELSLTSRLLTILEHRF